MKLLKEEKREYYNIVFNKTVKRTVVGREFIWEEGECFMKELIEEDVKWVMSRPYVNFVHSMVHCTSFKPKEDFNVLKVMEKTERKWEQVDIH